MASTDWSSIHPVCGGQTKVLPNAVNNKGYKCLACGSKLNDEEVIVFKSSTDERKLPTGIAPSDILSLSRADRMLLNAEDDDDEIRYKVRELLDEKPIF